MDPYEVNNRRLEKGFKIVSIGFLLAGCLVMMSFPTDLEAFQGTFLAFMGAIFAYLSVRARLVRAGWKFEQMKLKIYELEELTATEHDKELG